MKTGKGKLILGGLGHFVLLAFLLTSWLPLADIYYRFELPIGVDAVNFVYYTLNFRENMAFPVSAWKSQAFEGMPRLLDSSWLHFYLIQPLVSLTSVLEAAKLYPLIFHFLFLLFSYFLFYEISSNYLLAFGLTFLLSRTGAIYIPLYDSGVVLSSLSHTFFPAMFYFLTRFVKRGEEKSLVLAAVMLALGMYTHPGTTVVATAVPAVIFLTFFTSKEVSFFDIRKKLGVSFKFFLIWGLVGGLVIGPHAFSKVFEGGHQWLRVNLVRSEKAFYYLFSRLDQTIFLAIMVLAVLPTLFFIKRINRLFLPFFLILFYHFLFQLGLWLGKNPLGGFMFPHRIYWAGIVSFLALVAALASPRGMETLTKAKKGVYWLFTGLVMPAILISTWRLSLPEVLNFLPDSYFSKDSFSAKQIDPGLAYTETFLASRGTDLSFFEEGGIDYRFYALDYAANLKLGTVLPLPQAKGGFHYSTAKNVNWFAWLDAVVSRESQQEETIEAYVAEQQSLFLIDWYAIRYLLSSFRDPGILADWFLTDSPYVEVSTGGSSPLLKIRPELTSPIVVANQAKVIGFVGSDAGYDVFLRDLGILNYNSKYVIPIRFAEHLEDIEEADLKNLDGLFVYSYREKSKEGHLAAWEKVTDFVKGGGVVLVETGSDSPEKYLSSLPDIFPIERIEEESLGTEWRVTQKGDLFSEIDFSELSPLIYEGSYWGVGYGTALRPGGETSLALKGEIVVAEKRVGEGKVVWSGLNFPYRSHYFSENAAKEIQILKFILDKVFGVTQSKSINFVSERPKSEKVIVSGQGASGVLFKENYYGGWAAEIAAGDFSQRLKIYPAGVEMMYIPFPREIREKEFKLILAYRGKPENWFFLGVTVLGWFYVLDSFLTHHKLTKKILSPLTNQLEKFRGKTASWWDKDEEV